MTMAVRPRRSGRPRGRGALRSPYRSSVYTATSSPTHSSAHPILPPPFRAARLAPGPPRRGRPAPLLPPRPGGTDPRADGAKSARLQATGELDSWHWLEQR